MSYRFLRTPKWIGAVLVTGVLVALFVSLGMWQLERHRQREIDNTIRSTRLAEEPIPLSTALEAAGTEVDTLEYRRVSVTGVFLPEEEILVRSQVARGEAGFGVMTPLRLEDGRIVLVDRGWVPLAMDDPPVEPAPPADETTVVGVVRLSQPKPAFGPSEPPGDLEVVARVDLERIAPQLPGEALPVWVEVVQEGAVAPAQLPIPGELPSFDDPGPHLGYAFQWFAFAVIGLVGFSFLVVRNARDEKQPAPA